ncbi:hypothetical protein ABEG10_31045 [Burkholderia cenocepacia]|uniref:hypothetical protein n=1 Tax=Burkholderia cenocepacia TaxID=95486 RepID=UPI00209D96AB|nr:hypothetical protein [Burkholderia cenocepacia]MCO8327679.1 hypothetical protein [Burkholderia cenocepacia]MCO8334966.1 hypothetical protein [Burkholderia cenocepacia]MCO8342248.1 hypothetical protein [Burkholderia cenocepacia]MCO8349535.1 hypothetical protein [Burkholderia cenocepacia]MCO8362819.1 hypothetical protein [Burkholderia cenocepacia]
MDDRYRTIERDLAHVKSALQTLSEKREEFSPGAVISDPAYWRARLQSIRVTAERHNHPKLRDRADELLLELSKLEYRFP